KNTRVGCGPVFRRRSSEVPILRALKSASKATDPPANVSPITAGAVTPIAATIRSTTKTIGRSLASCFRTTARYHLRSPVTWPRMSWPDLSEAQRHAEALALAAIPIDPKLAARTQRDNETPHPTRLPLNLRLSRETATPSDWKPTGDGADTLDMPDFLRRR